MKIFEKGGKQNVFVTFLKMLKVKYTNNYSHIYYNQHPHKSNLYGLSKMLTEYGIDNTALLIENKDENILLLDVPFIALCGNDFVVVNKISADKVLYFWKGQQISISLTDFIQFWTGVVLIAEPNERSCEPNYPINKKNDRVKLIQKYLLLFSLVIFTVGFIIINQLFKSPAILSLIFINVLGLCTGCLLIMKQMHIQKTYIDKICSLFKKSDCNSILESKASKLFGIIGLSEIGLGYFFTNYLVMLMIPAFTTSLAIINIFGIPFCFWSLWYQKVKVKQWCPLCLIIQFLIVLIFFGDLLFGYINLQDVDIFKICFMICLYVISILIINISLPYLVNGLKINDLKQEMNSLKANEEVFDALLKKSPHYEVDYSISRIQFGNQNAKMLITILTNPHCEPCARMHYRIENLLSKYSNNFCVQYIFSTFDEQHYLSSKFLIASYIFCGIDESKLIYNKWFKDEKYRKEELFKYYDFNFDDAELLKEFESHKKWFHDSKIRNTPTILINGYLLPDKYKIEDLAFFEFESQI